MRFFQDKVLNRAKKTRRVQPLESDEDEDQDPQTLKYNSIRGYKTALIDLWSYQVSRGQHSRPHPNGNALRSIMKDSSRNQHIKKKLAFEDRGRGTVADGYDELALRRIMEEFWKQSHSAKPPVLGGNLRGRLDYLFGHLLLARGESRRFAELPDLQLLMFDNEGPTPCPALLYIMNNGKTNQNGRIEYNGMLRHKDLLLCGMSALAIYFFWRWEQSGEQFPKFENNKDWYNIRVLIGMFLNIYPLS